MARRNPPLKGEALKEVRSRTVEILGVSQAISKLVETADESVLLHTLTVSHAVHELVKRRAQRIHDLMNPKAPVKILSRTEQMRVVKALKVSLDSSDEEMRVEIEALLEMLVKEEDTE